MRSQHDPRSFVKAVARRNEAAAQSRADFLRDLESSGAVPSAAAAGAADAADKGGEEGGAARAMSGLETSASALVEGADGEGGEGKAAGGGGGGVSWLNPKHAGFHQGAGELAPRALQEPAAPAAGGEGGEGKEENGKKGAFAGVHGGMPARRGSPG